MVRGTIRECQEQQDCHVQGCQFVVAMCMGWHYKNVPSCRGWHTRSLLCDV